MEKSLSRIISVVFTLILLSLFSAGCSPQNKSGFNSSTAYDYLKKQVDFGPRVPGTQAHDECQKYITDELGKYTDQVCIQKFVFNAGGTKIPMTNVIGFLNPRASKSILLAAHWDSRPVADQEVLASDRKKPIPGANDGASGVAVLLELARMFSEQKPDVGVAFVFFDGEDYGPKGDDMYLGAKYFADNIKASLTYKNRTITPEFGILLDMIGDAKLNIYKERNSVTANSGLVDRIWNTADALGYSSEFPKSIKYKISDDHIPLIHSGIDCIDLIDFDYAYWHTLDDTPDKCSPESLKKVGEVVSAVVYETK